jgi:ribulose-5-phosphate 4-epimerase/fuculose-1-phosphate aldolase
VWLRHQIDRIHDLGEKNRTRIRKRDSIPSLDSISTSFPALSLLILSSSCSPPRHQTSTPKMSAHPPRPTLESLQRTYITACHILHHHNILDAYGHLSVRHPTNSSLFIMARYLPAALISSPTDLLEYRVSDAEPADRNAPKGYTERFIHSEAYKRFPDAHAVVHSHSNAVIPFGLVRGVGLRACVNTSGFLGRGTKVFDPRGYWREGDIRDLLVRSEHLGRALAGHFCDGEGETRLKRNVVLMRGHGMTVAAESIEHVVFRAIYAQNNAVVQTSAMVLASAARGFPVGEMGREGEGAGGDGGDELEITYLDDEEIADSTGINTKTALRPWRAWAREVEANGLYVNLACEFE